MADELTLTTYIVQFDIAQVDSGKDPTGYRFRFTDEAKARTYADKYSPSWGPVTITRESHTYRVGDAVTVQAFGRRRPGTVTRLLKTRVQVEYTRNAAGQRGQRDCNALEVRPAPATVKEG